MPRTIRALGDRGTRFSRSFATPPLCCPARAGWLTGQYPHNHGVFTNEPGYADLRQPRNVLPVWLDEAGYRTAFVGKYLNGTTAAIGRRPAPGWDRWFSLMTHSYFRPVVSDDGRRRSFSGRYVTRLLNARAARFARRAARRDRPFFLWLSHLAPHGDSAGATERCPNPSPQVPGKEYRRYAHAKMPRTPAFDEADVSDKPYPIRSLPRIGPGERAAIVRRYRCTLAAMRIVDRGVADVLGVLRRAGELGDTVVVFGDDNGYMFGEHRIRRGKSKIYRPSIEVPLVARFPRRILGGQPADRVPAPVGGIDLAPTFLELAGAAPCAAGHGCRTMDGRSLLAATRGEPGAVPRDRAILMEVGGRCHTRGVRTRRYSFAARPAECRGRRKVQLYDVKRDPHELRNLASSRVGPRRRLDARVLELAGCQGIEGRDPAPGPGRSFCE